MTTRTITPACLVLGLLVVAAVTGDGPVLGARLDAAACARVDTASTQDAPAGKPVKKIEDGVLDEIQLYVLTPPTPAQRTVVVHPFPAEKAELGTGNKEGDKEEQDESKQMQEQGPKLLADALVTQLKTMGGYKDVRGAADAPAGTDVLIVEGAFTTLDPGSRAKRYWVGFGAGKAVVAVAGTVKDASGKVLATFKQRRIATGGWAGGDSIKKMTSDCGAIGKDLAKFLSAWAKGQKLD